MSRRLLLVLLLGVLGLIVWLDQTYGLRAALTLANIKAHQNDLLAMVQADPLTAALIFVSAYALLVTVSFPGASLFTLSSGALFGLPLGLVLASLSSTIGACLAFLVSRYLLHDWVQARFGQRLAPLQEGLKRDGLFYLATLRLMPIFPFWLINLLMGLTQLKLWQYAVVSMLGMLPATLILVNAGTQIASINSLGEVFTPSLLGSLFLLGFFPLIMKAAMGWLQTRKRYQGFQKPRRFDRNLVVIGAGAGGLVSSYIAATVGAKVTLIEGHAMGGDCLNTGCVPSKALIRAAKLAHEVQSAPKYGFEAQARLDFPALMQRVHGVIRQIEPHDSVERYTSLGVEVLIGHARLIDPWTVEVQTTEGLQRLTSKAIILATGAEPLVPPLPGLAEHALTSETIWQLKSLPERLLVLGGGPIGSELSQSFARLGSRVTLIEMAPRLLAREEPEASALVAQALQADGVELLLGHQALRVESDAAGRHLVVKAPDGQEQRIGFDALLCAVGRKPRVRGYGLETLKMPLTERGAIATNAHLQTAYPNIYAVGDVAGPFQLTHAAAHQAWYAAVNALFGRFRRFRADYRVLPWATFTDPEVARVGLSVAEAEAQNIPFERTRYGLDDLDRAIADGSDEGFVQVLTVPGKDRILGVTIVGARAGDLIAQYALAMRTGLGLSKILGTVHAYPTFAESGRYLAGLWKKDHAPDWLLPWARRYHDWERR